MASSAGKASVTPRPFRTLRRDSVRVMLPPSSQRTGMSVLALNQYTTKRFRRRSLLWGHVSNVPSDARRRTLRCCRGRLAPSLAELERIALDDGNDHAGKAVLLAGHRRRDLVHRT